MRRVHGGAVRAMGSEPTMPFSGSLGYGTVLRGSLTLLSPTKHRVTLSLPTWLLHTVTHPQGPWGLASGFPAVHSREDSGRGHRGIRGQLASQPVPRPTALGTTEKARLYFTSSASLKLDMTQHRVGFQGLLREWQGGWVTKLGFHPFVGGMYVARRSYSELLPPKINSLTVTYWSAEESLGAPVPSAVARKVM